MDINNPSGIEEVLCKPMESLPAENMDKDLASLMLNLLMAGDFDLEAAGKEKPFLCKVIENRVKACFEYEIDDAANLFLAALCETPGKAIMYLWYFQYKYFKDKFKKLDLGAICKIFPMGFPSNEDMDKLWDAQKVPEVPDNLVDHASAGQSIFKENK